MASITSTKTLILEQPPSCIEFWPLDGRYVIVGTYLLEKSAPEDAASDNTESADSKTQNRSGSIVLFKISGDEITHIQTVPTESAILDLHFSPQDTSTFSIATSTGTLESYRLTTESNDSPPHISKLATFRIALQITLVLSFTFYAYNPTANLFAATLSTGETVIGHHTQLASPQEQEIDVVPILEHSLEAWTSAFTRDGDGIFSGGDDGFFQFRALRTLADLEPGLNRAALPNLSQLAEDGLDATWRDRRSHAAGVTAILPLTQDLVLTGSYDDHVRLIRTTVRPKVLVEENLGGGVWRLKLMEERAGAAALSTENEASSTVEFIVLASCMHAGARILRVRAGEAGEFGIDELAKFEEHESMNYGSDVQPVLSNAEHQQGLKKVIVSTSFYDKRLCLWRWIDNAK